MKTLQSTGRHHVIAIALLATTVFFNANAEDKKEDKKVEKTEAATTSNSIGHLQNEQPQSWNV